MANNKFCIECGYKLPRTAKFCEECGVKLTTSGTEVTEEVEEIEEIKEEVEERPSYLKKRGRYTPKPKETSGRTMQEATAEISRAYKEEEEEAKQERLSSYGIQNSSKKENSDTKPWYKHGIFIACSIFAFIGIVNSIRSCGGICSSWDPYNIGEIILLPIIILIVYGMYKLIKR